MIALAVGTLLTLLTLAYVLAPLFSEPALARTGLRDAAPPGERVRHGIESCPVCGPRPESDAQYCSSCGRHLGGPCTKCGAAIDQPGARFCASCGHAVAA